MSRIKMLLWVIFHPGETLDLTEELRDSGMVYRREAEELSRRLRNTTQLLDQVIGNLEQGKRVIRRRQAPVLSGPPGDQVWTNLIITGHPDEYKHSDRLPTPEAALAY